MNIEKKPLSEVVGAKRIVKELVKHKRAIIK